MPRSGATADEPRTFVAAILPSDDLPGVANLEELLMNLIHASATLIHHLAIQFENFTHHLGCTIRNLIQGDGYERLEGLKTGIQGRRHLDGIPGGEALAQVLRGDLERDRFLVEEIRAHAAPFSPCRTISDQASSSVTRIISASSIGLFSFLRCPSLRRSITKS